MNKTEEFIEKSKKIHGSKYDYTNSIYAGNTTALDIRCPIHGIFSQKPISHLRGSGCQLCAKVSKNLTTNIVVEKYKLRHNDLYDYSGTIYVNSDTKISIRCKEHGVFFQYPKDHEYGSGCPICCKLPKYSTEEFIEKSKKIHGSKYDYTNSKYVRNNYKTEIICNEHGSFMQSPSRHMQGYGCPTCGRSSSIKHNTKTTAEFIEEAKSIHGDVYDYTQVNYKDSRTNVDIICKIHGIFSQNPNNHLQSHGCPACAKEQFQSKPEFEIKEFIESLGIDIMHTVYIGGIELDLYIPSAKLAIEYNGLFYHSSGNKKDDNIYSKKHIHKTEYCETKGITLLHIFENEWLHKKNIWKSMIKSRLGFSTRIYGRKTIIKEISPITANEFYNNNHLQGSVKSKYHYGLYLNDILVAVMSLSKSRYNNYDYEVVRYCNLINHNVIGGFSKLLNHFRKLYSGSIVSYANKRWSCGNMYNKCNFVKDHTSKPCYYYIKGLKMWHRSSFMKHKLNKILPEFNPDETEVENMYRHKYRRIWDCGTIVYVLR
jgi:hypothetical protein